MSTHAYLASVYPALTTLPRAIRASLSALALLACATTNTFAQSETPAGLELEEITVTGSRIQRSGFTAPTPTTVMSGEDIDLRGVTNVGELVFEMPQFLPSQTTFNTGGGTNIGSHSYNLRGLGLLRTLTLVDGRRHVPDQITGVLNSNNIPAGVIERVEVVTGGASAAYGSDAVAGVVNILLRKDFEGLEGSVRSGESFEGDYTNYKGTLTYGTGFAGGRGHFLISGEMSDNDGVLDIRSRDWAKKNWLVVSNPNFVSGTGQYRRILTDDGHTANATRGGLIVSGSQRGTRFLPGGATAPLNGGQFPFSSGGTIGGDGDYNYLPGLATPLERDTVYARARYDLTERITAFVDASYAYTDGSIPEEFVSTSVGGTAITIRRENPFLPASVQQAMVNANESSFTMSRQNWDFGAFSERSVNRNRQMVVGFEGTFGETWSWNAAYSFGDNREVHTFGNDVITANLRLAADAVVNPANGQIVCRSTLTSPGNGCVPINLFGEGSPSPEALAYILNTHVDTVKYDQSVADFSIQGEPFSLWAGPVSIAAGGNYREDKFTQETDPVSAAGGHAIVNRTAIPLLTRGGDSSVREIFAETVIPLLADLPWAESLDFNGAVRITDQSLAGTVNTWKAGITYDVTDQLRLRTTRSRDIRSPNFSELTLEGIGLFSTVVDLNGSIVSIPTPQVGNPNLEPEKGDTWTAGIIYQPSWLSGLRLSADYWDIDISGAISSLTAQQIVDACRRGTQSACSAMFRDSAGFLTKINRGFFNANSARANGVDVEVSYVMPAARIFSGLDGNFALRAVGAYTATNETTILGQVTQLAGGSVPKWLANGSLSYSSSSLTLQLAGRYVDGIAYNTAFGPEDINVGEFSGRFYTSAAVQYRLPSSGSWDIRLFGNIDNLFDVDPPIIPSTASNSPAAMSRYNLFDPIGRRFTIGVRIRG